MNHLQAPKKQTQSNPISPTPKGVKQKSDVGFQRSDICLLSSAFCFLSSVQGPQDRNRLRLQRKYRDNLLDLGVLMWYNAHNENVQLCREA